MRFSDALKFIRTFELIETDNHDKREYSFKEKRKSTVSLVLAEKEESIGYEEVDELGRITRSLSPLRDVSTMKWEPWSKSLMIFDLKGRESFRLSLKTA